MKHLAFALLSVLTAISSYAQPKKISVPTSIESATVFLKGAEVVRVGSAQLPVGRLEVVVSGVSSQLNRESIQVKLEGDLTILAVAVRKNFLQEEKLTNAVQLLQNQSDSLDSKHYALLKSLDVLKQEETMLVRNQELKGGNIALKPADLKAALDFQRERLEALYAEQINVEKKIKLIEEKKFQIKQQIKEIQSSSNEAVSEIVATVECRKAVTSKVVASYLVQSAGWEPTYGISVKDIASPLEIQFTANVYQSSGEDWKNCKLSLSSGNPSQHNQKPELTPWFLRYYEPAIIPGTLMLRGKVAGLSAENKLEDVVVTGYGNKSAKREIPTPVSVETVYQPTTTKYEIKELYTVLSDGKKNAIDVRKTTVPAEYEYYAAPKVDARAYLVARIVNWQSLELLKANANLFFEDTFLGSSVIDPALAEDTLLISLGKDNNVVVKRTLVTDQSARRFIGGNKTETKQYELSVRNNKKQPIKLVLEDQYPISTAKEMEVDRVNHSGGRLNEATGLVSWNLELGAGAEQKKQIRYTVKYPKERRVLLD